MEFAVKKKRITLEMSNRGHILVTFEKKWMNGMMNSVNYMKKENYVSTKRAIENIESQENLIGRVCIKESWMQ